MRDESIVATQARSLIRQLQEDQEQRCRDVEREAEAWRRERLREARREARGKVEAAIRLARERRRIEIAAANAQIVADRSRQRQLHLSRLLSQVMRRIPDELSARWRDERTRSRWIGAALRDAKRRLGASDWTIRCAPGITPDERVAEFEGANLTWIEDDDLAAGLIVAKHGARMDASTDGLLAGTGELESRILKMLNEAMSANSS